MAANLPDLAPLEAVTAGLEMALHELEMALNARETLHRRQHGALAEKLERVIAGIEPLIAGEAPSRRGRPAKHARAARPAGEAASGKAEARLTEAPLLEDA